MGEWSFQRKLISGVILICLLAIMTSAGALFASRFLIANLAQVSASATAAKAVHSLMPRMVPQHG